MIVIDYIKALFLPTGRLPRMSYIAMILPLAFLHLVFYKLATQDDGADVHGIYSGMILLLVWMKFCVVSRRMHDLGRTNLMAAALFLVSVFIFLAELDPKLLGKTEEAQQYWGGIMGWAAIALRLAWFMVSIELFKQEGAGGPNVYGPEFGDVGRSQLKADNAAPAMAASSAAQHGVITMGHGPVTPPTQDAPKPQAWTPIIPDADTTRRMRKPNPFIPG